MSPSHSVTDGQIADGWAGSAVPLQERLQDPMVAQSLHRLLDKLDSVAFFVESVDGFVRRGDVIADSLASTVAEMRDHSDMSYDMLKKVPQAMKMGSDLAEAASSMKVENLTESKILERLTEPGTLAAINQLLDQLPLLAMLGQMLEKFLVRGDVIADNLSDAIKELHLKDIGPERMLRTLEALPKLQEIGDQLIQSGLLGEGVQTIVDAGKAAIDAGLLDHDNVATLSQLGRQSADALREAQQQPAAPVVGIFGMMRMMRDPEVQKSLGFMMAFAKSFAKRLK